MKTENKIKHATDARSNTKTVYTYHLYTSASKPYVAA